MAGSYLEIRQGDSYIFSTNIAVDGVGTNLSGAYLWFYAKADPENDEDSEVIINASTNGGEITVSGANNNVVSIALNAATTANYPQTNIFHWGLRCQVSSNVYTLDHGLGCVVVPVVQQPWG